MIDFLTSIHTGLQSAINRERNFVEIHSIFQKLKDQIEEFTNNAIKVELLYTDNELAFDYFITNKELYYDKELYFCLSSDPEETFEDITMVNFSDNGYPCTILIDGDVYDAIDKISLEENLKKLMESPATGQKLFLLMQEANILTAP